MTDRERIEEIKNAVTNIREELAFRKCDFQARQAIKAFSPILDMTVELAALALAARRTALEEAKAECDDQAKEYTERQDEFQTYFAKRIAAQKCSNRIQALIDKDTK